MSNIKRNNGGLEFDERKFAELVIYISAKSRNDGQFGRTKLNKLLYFADFLSYARRRRSITGSEYQRIDHGPAPRQMLPVYKMLEQEKALAFEEVRAFDYTRKAPVALRDADLSLFSAEEIALVDEVLEKLSERDGSALSRYTHEYQSWLLTNTGETIPYFSVCLPKEPLALTPEEQAFGEKLAASIGGWN